MTQIQIRVRCNCSKPSSCGGVKRKRKSGSKGGCRLPPKKQKKSARPYVQIVIQMSSPCTAYRPPVIRVKPNVNRFFFVVPDDICLIEETVLSANQFVDDQGEAVAHFADAGPDSYNNLYVNGLLQEGALYRVSPQAITLAPTGQSIVKGTPVILEMIGFSAKLN